MMKVKKKQTREERLEKKRQAEKLRYQRIKNDPVKNAQLKEKEKQQYKKKKEKGQIKSIKDMSEREQRGLLVLTGVLWGCTNPFIKRGTRGLREVKSGSWAGQAYAEVKFLLGNWSYITPWLLNQAGSLSYLCAVQAAPLSTAVPVANGLAFAFTALTAAVIGDEEPLDRSSILGVALIVAGTALCCLDRPM